MQRLQSHNGLAIWFITIHTAQRNALSKQGALKSVIYVEKHIQHETSKISL